MILGWMRRRRGPLVCMTFTAFMVSTVPLSALAQDQEQAAPAPEVQDRGAGQLERAPLDTDRRSVQGDDEAPASTPDPDGKKPSAADIARSQVAEDKELAKGVDSAKDATQDQSLRALPSGEDKSGVTSKTISVPKGSGTVKGMEESFSAQLSTGEATYSVPFALPAARGGAQPALGLSYSSSAGFGNAGVGWSLGVPFVARQTDRGIPNYDDGSTWQPNQDRFVFNGGQELVPICDVGPSLGCTGALAGEVMPAWSRGWQYHRARVEGSFLRFFWSPNRRTWRVQGKDGSSLELGVPLDGSGYSGGLESNPEAPSEIYRWHLVREYDSYGDVNPSSGNPRPVNVVYYRHTSNGGSVYLTDIYDTSPADDPTTLNLARFAHHTRLEWEQRADTTFSYRSGWRMEQNLRLRRVDVTSANSGGTGNRRLVRRYDLSYDTSYHASLLSTLNLRGRCAWGADGSAPKEVQEAGGQLPNVLPCVTDDLPATRFEYSHVGPASSDGFEPFSDEVRSMANSPAHSVDEQYTDLFDINSDGLPDVLVTAPGQYGGGHGVFFNGAGGGLETFGNVEQMSLLGVLGANANTLALKNPNLVPLDLDGDGSINLLHMPQTKTYASYTPVKTASGWQWQGQSIATADGLDARIDFGNDSLETQVMDVNFDGLVDVVLSSGSAMQTFFSLGRFPRGDGQFGNATMLSASAADLSNDPVETCLPWSSQPIRFSDPDVKVADMNGDGIADIVRARRGELRYWPGRGNGFWGTGNRGDCGSGAFGTGRHIEMSGAPFYSDLQGTSIRLEDVNGDGLTDLVQVRFDEVDVWLNVNGTSWTERRIIDHTPVSPSFASRVRLVDVDGSGTRDILWGDAGNYRYIDLQGGTRPWLLTQVHNGLGKTTSLEYATSADEMLAADAAGKPWTSRAPLVVQVVKRMTETDNLNVFGNGPRSYVTEYSYRDPVYDGRQREFRGFRSATSRSLGDSNSPTSVARSELLMGECLYPSGAPCAVADQSYDNPHEALKGLPVLSETFDEQGVYLSTTLNQYTLRRLYQGLDGRGVAYAFQSGGSTWSYDTSNFIPSSSVLQGQSTVLAEGSGVGPSLVTSVPVRAQSGTVRTQGESEVDDFGNQLSSTSFGCVSGCPAGVDEAITGVTEPVLLNHPSGWLWRTDASYTVGSINTARRGETHTSFTPEGDPDRVTAVLTGTEALQRSHATGQTIAPIPGDAVADSPTLFVSQTEYDEFGNAIRSYAPGGRCADVFLDPLFGQLATTEIMYPGGCPGARSLSDPPADALYTAAAYDRGLELVTHVIDVSFQITQVEYDGLGRLVRLYRSTPDAATVGALPAVTIRYDLATPARPYSMVHTRSQDGAQPSSAAYMDSYAYVDGLGRTLVGITEADPGASDDGAWIAGGFMDYDRKGAVSKKYLPKFWDGNPEAFNLAATPDTAFGRVEYDAFGRDLRLYDLDGTQTLLNVYHPLSSDAWDAADSQRGGPHEGTYVTSVSDGHGRGVLGIERFKEGGSLIQRETRTSFLPTGEPLSITRSSVHGATTRWLRYDSIGRMVLNVEPHTSTNFDPDPTADASNIRAWRYLYNASGELVATSDARGCGLNFAYDGVGRLLYEDYSPCEAGHQAYSPPSLGGAAPTGVEVYYQYDRLPSPALGTPEVPTGSGTSQQFTQYGSGEFLRGKLVAVFDRSKATWTNFDGRSRAWESWVQLAAPGLPDNALADRYLGRWYRKQVNFDAADRVVQETTGAQSPELQGADGESWVDIAYSGRGTVKSVGGSYGALVTDIKRTADSLHEHIEYGDLAATRTQFAYDPRRRLSSVQTYRGPPSAWTNPPGSYMVPANPGQTTFQKVLQDDRYTYDIVSNPELIEDLRNPDEWPTGAKPVTRRMRYDDLYRVSRVDYEYAQGDDQVQNPQPAPSRMGPLGRRTTTAPRLSPKQLAALLAAVNTPGDPAPPRPPLKLSPKQLLPGVVPVVTAPIGQLHDSVPLYAWTPQVGATEYELRVDGPSGPVISERYSPTETGCAGASAECNQTPAVVLQPGSHTVWVRAHHQTQAGPWSAPEVFNVVAPLVDQDDGWEDPNSGLADARRAEPTPYQEFENRIRYQAWDYDWLGNTQQTDDDAKGFYDRSLGNIENGPLAGKAYQLQAADNRSSGSARQGALRTTYDVTGNLTEMRLDRDGTCIPSGRCSQIFRYEWDEVGRLVSAKRWDASSLLVSDTTPPSGVADVELHYGYDASDMRVSKRAVDTLGEESWTLYLFNSLELRRTNWSTAEQDYALTPMTEVAYLFANGVRLARLAYEPPGDVPSINGENLHVFFELGDHLGSTSVVLDKATGELVERSTYQAYGGTESDYRPERWKSFREDYRFTGKEEDVEAGLIYFGKRFLNPLLNRWVSADPLTVHGLGADPNLYAYVSGRALQATDPLGLCTGKYTCSGGSGKVDAAADEMRANGVAAMSAARAAGTHNAELDGMLAGVRRDTRELKQLGVMPASERLAIIREAKRFRRDNWLKAPTDPELKQHYESAYKFQLMIERMSDHYTRTESAVQDAFDPHAKGERHGIPGPYLKAGRGKLIARAAAAIAAGMSRRLAYLGRTPGKSSRVGREVLARYRRAGRVREVMVKGEKVTEVNIAKRGWTALRELDMAHKPQDAVRWWNNEGRHFGPRSPEVRKWMLDSKNYTFQHFSTNRSLGARLKTQYDAP